MDDKSRDEKALEQRIRRRAYQLWLDAGKPEGLADAHWDQASELVAIEDGQRATLIPVSDHEVRAHRGGQKPGRIPDAYGSGRAAMAGA